MSVQMIASQGTIEHVILSQLIDLEEAGFKDALWAMREKDTEHIAHLVASDEKEWPPLETVKVQLQGKLYHAVIDGYHRWDASTEKKLATLAVVARTYQSEAEVIETAFRANLKHGKSSSTETRGEYAVWLYCQDKSEKPNLSAIARKVGLNQSTVSRAVKKFLREMEADEEAESTGASRADVDNTARLVSALRKFFETERSILGMLGDGTGKRDVNARAKALRNHLAHLETEKRKEAMRILYSLHETLEAWVASYPKTVSK